MLSRLSDLFWRRPLVLLCMMLALPVLWLGVIYIGSLFALLAQSFFSIDEFSGLIRYEFTLKTYGELLTPANLDIIIRTVLMAASVTLAAIVIAFPIAFFAARYARGRWKALFYLGVMLPLWSSYLVKVYAWKLILAKEGILNWLFDALGLSWLLNAYLAIPVLGGNSLSVSYTGTFLVFLYVWIPFMVLPMQAALERVPVSFLEASSDMGARPSETFRHVVFRWPCPAVIAGSIFTFSLTLGDYIIPQIVGSSRLFIGQGPCIPIRARPATFRLLRHSPSCQSSSWLSIFGWQSVRERSMHSDDRPRAPLTLKVAAAAGLAFMHLPILLIFVYAFTTEDKTYQWPPPDYTLKWFAVTWNRPDVWDALKLSLQVAALSTVIAIVLGTLCAAAVSRSKFFGRETVSLLVILPIALPGIITGIALRSAFNIADIPFSMWTIVLGHATFCIVVVYNNAVARFRRTSASIIEASMDLGADGFQTFRYVVLPNIATALLAGGMLAFALSFDEVIVTTLTAGQQATLPIWMLEELVRPRQRPVTNVVAMVVVLVTFLPILGAYYLTRDTHETAGQGK